MHIFPGVKKRTALVDISDQVIDDTNDTTCEHQYQITDDLEVIIFRIVIIDDTYNNAVKQGYTTSHTDACINVERLIHKICDVDEEYVQSERVARNVLL